MALEPIDYTTHSRSIEDAYQKIVRGSDPDTTWLILSPNANKEYDADLLGNGFTDFLQSFDDTKVQFGLARVSPPGSDVEKNILIGWCPDSAPMKTRASFAANFGDVANNVLKGYHVQVTARDEDDLNEKDLLMKISNAAGARYSIQSTSSSSSSAPAASSKPKAIFTKKAPVQTQSQPEKLDKPSIQTLPPKKFVKAEEPEDDWDEPEVEERDLTENPLKPNQSSWKPVGKVDLQKVIAEEKAKEDPRLVHNSSVVGTKPPVNSGFMKKDDDDKVIKGFRTEKSPAQIWAEKKAAQNKSSTSPSSSFDRQKQQQKEEEPIDDDEQEMGVNDLKSRFEKFSASSEPPVIKPMSISKPQPEATQPVKMDPRKFGTPLPGMHNEDEDEEKEDENDEWDEDETESNPTLPSRNTIEVETEQAAEEEEEVPVRVDEEMEEEEDEEVAPPSLPSRGGAAGPPPPALPSRNTEPEPEEEEEEEEELAPVLPSRGEPAPASASAGSVPPPPPRKPAQSGGPSAVAEYDYDAAEDNELTFVEGDKIVNIEFVDDDWWLGELEKTGEKGLFPSNYVSLED
ncbi:hypothetical protein Kpol_325p12 [Vanderwaltozyma polyspora DSM 70294]|uniref:Actin-binding protein n=1 Tax=Vanderwaltozyma polyspora (strain ATCC 22028 / DSM 70294 / BCRC 21397 / CBS 2163 / NBRC 10782 / NRRL Y-8283 / UCD 57-17) TaxID=436907 RepID=A7TSU5_VANPO|nr:uncharacterized protein Kpol_325p12 [Vanderwaltozyma polyspora DSM 70294]EDO14673.1 hypothetical protein Kpol_325p12 [Vanderwaltozyma polyspora DSM 70294]